MKHLHGLALLIAIFITGSRASQPTALYYHDQLVDHTQATENKWTQRYYTSDEHFAGPGHPIFLVMGGEGAIPESTGLFYSDEYWDAVSRNNLTNAVAKGDVRDINLLILLIKETRL